MRYLLRPEPPSGVWVLEDEAGEIVYEGGRCGEGWYAASPDSPLADELDCRACGLELYARSMPRGRPPDNGDRRTLAEALAALGWVEPEGEGAQPGP